MIIRYVKLCNFRSFLGEHKFDLFDEGAGIHSVRGINGSGKSSLFEAVFWTFYGKTTRNLKAGHIQNWATKDQVLCEVGFDIDGKSQVVRRTWGPITLKINNKDADQSEVDELVRLSSDSFQHAVLIGQFATTFFDLAPTPKLAVFSKVLELDDWLQRSISAGDAYKKLEAVYNQLLNKLGTLDGQADELERQLKEYEQLSKSFDSQKKKNLEMYEAQIAQLDEEAGEFEVQINPMEKAIKELISEQVEIGQARKKLTEDLKSYQQKLADCAAEMRQLDKQMKSLIKEFEDFESLGPTCDVCRQPIGEEHTAQIAADYDNQLKELEQELDAQKQVKEDIQMGYDKVQGALDKADKEDAQVTGSIRKKESEFNKLNSEYNRRVIDMEKLEKLSEGEHNKENPYDQMIANGNHRVETILAEFETINNKVIKTETDMESAQFWMSGFKEVRLLVLEQALTTLEVEINNYLVELGLVGWQISFDVERETKSGGVSKGFVTNITSPQTTSPVPWEAWSGGELQRLRIAGALGIANLIRRHLGLTEAPLILDEPTQHLSQEGIEDLVSTLVGIAESEQIPIWLIDHRSLDSGRFTSITTVEKTKDGSRFQKTG